MKRVLVAAACLLGVYGVRLALQPAAPAPILVVAASAAAVDTPQARGRIVYERYGCAVCHGDDAKGGFANPNAETEGKVPPVNYVAEGYTRPELRQKILNGLATVGKKDAQGPRPPYRMPGWAGVMSDPELNDLVEYLWSLLPKSGGDKWK